MTPRFYLRPSLLLILILVLTLGSGIFSFPVTLTKSGRGNDLQAHGRFIPNESHTLKSVSVAITEVEYIGTELDGHGYEEDEGITLSVSEESLVLKEAGLVQEASFEDQVNKVQAESIRLALRHHYGVIVDEEKALEMLEYAKTNEIPYQEDDLGPIIEHFSLIPGYGFATKAIQTFLIVGGCVFILFCAIAIICCYCRTCKRRNRNETVNNCPRGTVSVIPSGGLQRPSMLNNVPPNNLKGLQHRPSLLNNEGPSNVATLPQPPSILNNYRRSHIDEPHPRVYASPTRHTRYGNSAYLRIIEENPEIGMRDLLADLY